MKALILAAVVGFALSSPSFAGKRDDMVNEDKRTLEKNDAWIYNDMDAGLAKAKAEGKPLFVVYRCIP